MPASAAGRSRSATDLEQQVKALRIRPGPYGWAALAYSGLAVVLTFPLVLHLSSVVPHDVGDSLLSTAILRWNAHVMPFTTRWWNGFAFYPAPGFMAFSDPRLGESLLATPLQWLGCTPVAAYNLTLLATFRLCALAAHWLGVVLTGRHDAATVAGLAYGFCPSRIAHLPHLELLAAFGPLVLGLARIHRYYGFERSLTEISTFSADLTSLLTAHEMSWLWGWTAGWAKSQGELFPGAHRRALICSAVVRTSTALYLADRGRTRHRGRRMDISAHPFNRARDVDCITRGGIRDRPRVAAGRYLFGPGGHVPDDVPSPSGCHQGEVVVEKSADDRSWIVVADRRLAGLTMTATLDNPQQVAVPIPLAPSDARFVRLRIDKAHGHAAWHVAELTVRAAHQSD